MGSRRYEQRVDESWYPAARVSQLLSRKWAIPIVYVLMKNKQLSFEEIARELSINAKSESDSLTHLRDNDIVDKVPVNDGKKQANYQLTDKGNKLEPIIREMEKYYEENP